MTTEEAIKILNRNKPEYGTPEYWVKERRSKFKINARQKQEQEEKLNNGILNMWSLVKKVDMPLYNMTTIKPEVK
jgi:hypothetical protein